MYDRIGRFQDWQIYEGRAIRDLVRLGAFDESKSVFEFGCGTGAFVARLLKSRLPPDCQHVGIDVSPRMVRLAKSRLTPWAERATVRLSDGSPRLNEADGTFDHFVSTYVLDLLAPEYASATSLKHTASCEPEASCAWLAWGKAGPDSRIVTALSERIWRWKPELLGGCRPIDLRRFLVPQRWVIQHYNAIVWFGITSEIVVASRRSEEAPLNQ